MTAGRLRVGLPADESRQLSLFEDPAKKRSRRLRRIRRWILGFLGCWILAGISLTLPLRWVNPSTTAFVLQDDNRTSKTLHSWRDFESLGANLAIAVVAAEDQRFDQHAGLDIQSIRDSIEDSKNGDRLRGASTLTQQLAKNIYLWPDRSFLRKGFEAWLALNLELFLPKQRILELYLNVAEFGPGIYGAAEASRHFFGKEPALLSMQEAALLAAVLPSPRRFKADAPSAYVRERQRWIETQMNRLKRENWLYTITR